MSNFLEQTAAYLYTHHRDVLGEVCVVLPNRRAGLYLKKYLAQITDKPVFAPAVYSIEDFVYRVTGLKMMEPAYLYFEFYEVYREIEGPEASPFSDFIKWAEIVLKDFNEVDLYLVNPEELFGYLSDSKAIALWNLDEEPLTAFELRYLRFFNSLTKFYQKFSNRLLAKNQAYQGLAYRELVTKLEKENEDMNLPWKHLVFAGFNALSLAEEKILKTLVDRGAADLVWDADRYYLENPLQEAGMFLRHNQKVLGLDQLTWTGDHFKGSEKTIRLIGVPKNIGQAKVTGELLRELHALNPGLEKTSVVLNDQNLLAPVLNSLPEEVKSFNLTMGLPLKNTQLYSLVSAFIQLNENAVRFSRASGKSLRFYFKDLLQILEHPAFRLLTRGGAAGKPGPAQAVRSGNRIFYDRSEVEALFAGYEGDRMKEVMMLFEPWNNSSTRAVDGVLFLLKKLKLAYTSNEAEKDLINQEYVFHFSKLFNKLRNYFTEYPFLKDLESFRLIYTQVVRSITIPFYGEPLRGVQVMGMLETRTLDFENIIMLSVNEDFIPGGSTGNSFIPFEIKRKFRLPTHRERNAVSAYHFYRLLQRARNIYLLFNTEAGDLGGGDKSRFINQIEYELQKYNPGISIVTEVLAITPGPQPPEADIRIDKTPDILEKIRELARSGFSASALNSYRNCSLQYYFKYILGIDEAEEVEETIEASTLGNVVHDVLFQLYSPFKGKALTREVLKTMKPEVDKALKASFKKHYPSGDILSGKNLLISKVAESFVLRFLQTEEMGVAEAGRFNRELTILDLEMRSESTLDAGIPGVDPVKLKGVIDRIDQLAGEMRIIDYKTGRVNATDLKLKTWEDLNTPGKHDKIFQLLFYAHLYSAAHGFPAAGIQAGIFSFRNLNNGLITPVLPEGKSVLESIPDFGEVLAALIASLFDLATPIRQTEDIKVCEYCSYRSVCNR